MSGLHDTHKRYQKMGNRRDQPIGSNIQPRVSHTPHTPPPHTPPPHTPHTPRKMTKKPVVDQRVAIAIDVQNLYYGARDLFGTKIAYEKFMNKILRGRKLSRSIAYIASREGNNQDSFIKLLQGIGCDTKQKDVVERSGSMKCNWDVEIAVDALAMASKIDVFVLASGDGDFTYLLKALLLFQTDTPY